LPGGSVISPFLLYNPYAERREGKGGGGDLDVHSPQGSTRSAKNRIKSAKDDWGTFRSPSRYSYQLSLTQMNGIPDVAMAIAV